MKYLKGAQFVPAKGEAWMYYEVDDKTEVVRSLTHIPSTGELTKYPNPPIRRLFRPELLQEATAEEFRQLWELKP